MKAPAAIAAALLLATLTGCAIQRGAATAPPDWARQAQRLGSIDHWSLTGRLASKGVSDLAGRLQWEQRGDEFDIRISGPFGVGAHRATGNATQVEVEHRDQRWLLPDPDAFLSDEFGWQVPFEALRYWVVGLPQPGQPSEPVFDTAGRLVALTQLGWQLEFERHRRFDAFELPARVTISNPTARIRLVIDAWQPIEREVRNRPSAARS